MLDRINLICYNKIVTDLRRYIRRKGVIMETKTALKELVTKYVENAAFKAAAEYYNNDNIPTKEELEYLDEFGLNFTEFAAHYEVVTLDAPDGEIRTVDSTCDLEEALKWYNEEINGYVYIQFVDHESMLIAVLKCNF